MRGGGDGEERGSGRKGIVEEERMVVLLIASGSLRPGQLSDASFSIVDPPTLARHMLHFSSSCQFPMQSTVPL